MAVTMGGVSSFLVGFNSPDATTPSERLISQRTIDVITCVYTPLAMLIMAYALFSYEFRNSFMKKKQVRDCKPHWPTANIARAACTQCLTVLDVLGARQPHRRHIQAPRIVCVLRIRNLCVCMCVLCVCRWVCTTTRSGPPPSQCWSSSRF